MKPLADFSEFNPKMDLWDTEVIPNTPAKITGTLVCKELYRCRTAYFLTYMGLSENRVYSQTNSHLKTGLSDQQNHWVHRGTQHFQTHPY